MYLFGYFGIYEIWVFNFLIKHLFWNGFNIRNDVEVILFLDVYIFLIIWEIWKSSISLPFLRMVNFSKETLDVRLVRLSRFDAHILLLLNFHQTVRISKVLLLLTILSFFIPHREKSCLNFANFHTLVQTAHIRSMVQLLKIILSFFTPMREKPCLNFADFWSILILNLHGFS